MTIIINIRNGKVEEHIEGDFKEFKKFSDCTASYAFANLLEYLRDEFESLPPVEPTIYDPLAPLHQAAATGQPPL